MHELFLVLKFQNRLYRLQQSFSRTLEGWRWWRCNHSREQGWESWETLIRLRHSSCLNSATCYVTLGRSRALSRSQFPLLSRVDYTDPEDAVRKLLTELPGAFFGTWSCLESRRQLLLFFRFPLAHSLLNFLTPEQPMAFQSMEH